MLSFAVFPEQKLVIRVFYLSILSVCGRIVVEYIRYIGVYPVRIIAGERKGLPLKSVPGESTRPTTDKVKEAIFNMIGPYFDGGLGLDLYAGSGSLGIEALSRGLSKVIFVDRDLKAVQTIKFNLKRSQYASSAEVYRNDAKAALRALKKRNLKFSYIFLDPPYNRNSIKNEIESIYHYQLLETDGKVIAEHSSKQELPETIEKLEKQKFEIYGNTAISIYAFKEE